MRYVMRKEWTLACNWKVYVDNYLEGYHIPVVHPGLHKEIDYDSTRSSRIGTSRSSTRRCARCRRRGGGDRKYDPSGDGRSPRRTTTGSFPNVMLNVYMGQMQTNVVATGRARRTGSCSSGIATEPPADPATDAEWTKPLAFSDEIQDEDIEICEAVQKKPPLARL